MKEKILPTIWRGTLAAGISLAPVSPVLAQGEQPSSISQPAEGGETVMQEYIDVPVFIDAEIPLDVSQLRIINSPTNLRAEPSTQTPIVTQIQPGSIVKESEPPIDVSGFNWYTTTVLYNGAESTIITETANDQYNGYLREDVRGTEVDISTLPEELISLLAKDNVPPVSLSGEFSVTQSIKKLKGIGGTGELNTFISSLFNQPETISTADGSVQTFVEYAASGEDISALIDLLTGLAIFEQKEQENIFPNVNTTEAVTVTTDSEGNILSFNVGLLRLPVANGEDLFLTRSGKRITTEGKPDYFDQSNTLLSYPQLRTISDTFAKQTAVTTQIMSGLENIDGVVKAPADNVQLTEVLDLVDSVYTNEYGIIDLPGNLEVRSHLKEGQEIGGSIFTDGQMVVYDVNGQEILHLQPSQEENGTIEWEEVAQPLEYDNDYFAQLLNSKPLKEFNVQLAFDSYISSADTKLLIPVGNANGFTEKDAESIQDVYNILFENSPAFKEFISNTLLRSVVNYTYPEERSNILSSPNFVTWFNPELGQVDAEGNLTPEGKKTWGNTYVIQIEYDYLHQWARSIDPAHEDEIVKGLFMGVLLHESTRISNASKSSPTGLADDPSVQEEALFEAIMEDFNRNSVTLNPYMMKGYDINLQHLRNSN